MASIKRGLETLLDVVDNTKLASLYFLGSRIGEGLSTYAFLNLNPNAEESNEFLVKLIDTYGMEPAIVAHNLMAIAMVLPAAYVANYLYKRLDVPMNVGNLLPISLGTVGYFNSVSNVILSMQ